MDLSEYKEKFPKSAKRLDKLEKNGKRAEILLDLKNHVGMKMIEEALVEKVNTISSKLHWERDMTKEERDCLIRERDCWFWYIDEMANAEKSLKLIDTYINNL